ncbi:MAG TPA: GH3 auxin-responsive promoter family protein [Lacunisphaera sp.]|nr:GH3 auxin-responsive promoter family protein [Lacunisphaera sp.]
MTLAPRFLVNFWAGWRVAQFSRRLRDRDHDATAQAGAFARLMARTARTEFGRAHSLAADTPYARFRERVPPRLHDHFAPLVARMAAGEAHVLAPGRCNFFVETAGTTGATPKLLPVTDAMLAHYRRGLCAALFFHAARVGHTGVFLGRHLHAGASTAVTEDQGTYRTSLDGMFALCLSPWAEANLYAPPPAIARLPAGPEKQEQMARAMIPRDVTLIGGTPAEVCALAEAVCAAASAGAQRAAHLQAVWPNLECFTFTGAPLGLLAEALRATLGPTVAFQEIYAAAEGVIAAQDDHGSAGLRLLADAGVFFEFLPLRLFHEETLAHAGSDCVPLAEVQVNVDYVLVLTTPAGLCRYVPGDIVRFQSLTPPRLQFVGRTQLQLNAASERVTERELLDTLLAVCTRNGWQPVGLHVAPYRRRIAAGRNLNCHEWWLELRPLTTRTPTANVLGPQFDAELARRNPDYAARRAAHVLDQPSIRLVIPGVFAQWAQARQKEGGAGKLPLCRADRLVADQLAALTKFHQETMSPYENGP